jgi:hypothetical protein
MSTDELMERLYQILGGNDPSSQERQFDDLAGELVERGAGIEEAECVFRFVEKHWTSNGLEYFLERFSDRGYQDWIIESIEQKPRRRMVWLLYRAITHERDVDLRQVMLDLLEQTSCDFFQSEEIRSYAAGLLRSVLQNPTRW